jgi:hypothetical protein
MLQKKQQAITDLPLIYREIFLLRDVEDLSLNESAEVLGLILTADERVFELPLGFSERLHARLEAEIRAIAPAPSDSEEKDSVEKKANLKEPDEPSGE